MSRDRALNQDTLDKRAEITLSRSTKMVMSREDYRRKKQNMKPKGELDIDMSKKPLDMTYRWLSISVLNEPYHARETYMHSEGWTPVPADRHPEALPPDFLGRKQLTHNYIERRGLLLCERPTVYVEVDEEDLNEQTRQITEGLPAVNNPMNDQLAFMDPLRSNTQVSRTYTVRRDKAPPQVQGSDFGQ